MPAADAMIENEQVYRAGAYSLLAALLRAAPDQALLDHLQFLSPSDDGEQDALYDAMSSLAEAAREQNPLLLEDEYSALFIGIGKGEVVPYGSWYLTGFLMEQPLSDLRDDLRLLGFERNAGTSEPEDHVAAIFEVFSVMIADASGLSEQRRFFDTHMQSWLGRFFEDLSQARSSKFYKHVAQFGAAFIDLEQNYLSMHS
ncbi:MAG: molecular chaperone TorD family protein [Gammaproteobacteria bacterium]|nr:molecular chaperone TorD family protein [Gammaproteobacteria bacterium]